MHHERISDHRWRRAIPTYRETHRLSPDPHRPNQTDSESKTWTNPIHDFIAGRLRRSIDHKMKMARPTTAAPLNYHIKQVIKRHDKNTKNWFRNMDGRDGCAIWRRQSWRNLWPNPSNRPTKTGHHVGHGCQDYISTGEHRIRPNDATDHRELSGKKDSGRWWNHANDPRWNRSHAATTAKFKGIKIAAERGVIWLHLRTITEQLETDTRPNAGIVQRLSGRDKGKPIKVRKLVGRKGRAVWINRKVSLTFVGFEGWLAWRGICSDLGNKGSRSLIKWFSAFNPIKFLNERRCWQ